MGEYPAFGWGWSRYPRYRLMKLTRTGQRNEVAHGSLIYLLRLAGQSRIRGRQWIELNMEPATAPRCSKPDSAAGLEFGTVPHDAHGV